MNANGLCIAMRERNISTPRVRRYLRAVGHVCGIMYGVYVFAVFGSKVVRKLEAVLERRGRL